MGLRRYDDALISFEKSYLLDDHLIDHKTYDMVFNHVNKTDYSKAFDLIRIKDSFNKNNNKKALFYFKKFTNENNLSDDELLEILDIDKLFFKNDSKPILNEEKKSELLIEKVMNNPVSIYDDYHGYLRNISYLSEARRGNDEALLVMAYYLLEGGLLERSLECYELFLKKYENDKRGIYGKIVVLNELGHYDDSLKLIESFTAKYWKYLRSEILVMNGKTRTSFKILNTMFNENKNDVTPLLSKAMIYLIDLKIDKALNECDNALKISPGNVDALLLKGELLFGLHNYAEASHTFNKIPNEKLPNGYVKLITYIENYKGENSGFYGVFWKSPYWEYVYVESDTFKRLKSNIFGDLKNEVIKRGLIWKCINKDLQMKTTSQNKTEKLLVIEQLYDFGENYNTFKIPNINENMLKIYDDALKSYDPLKSYVKDYVILNNKGYILLKLERIDESIDCFDNALKINPNDYHAWFNKGFAHLKNEDYSNAKKCLIKALELNKFEKSIKDELLDYIFDLGGLLYGSGKFKDSNACYDICIKIKPKIRRYRKTKAIFPSSLEEYNKAIQFYNNAFEFNHYNYTLLNNIKNCIIEMIEYYFCNEDYEECIAFCEKLLMHNDFNSDVYVWLKKIDPKIEEDWLYYIFSSYRDIKNYQKAIDYLDKLLEKDEENDWYFTLKGLCLRSLGKFEESIKYFDKAIEYYTDDNPGVIISEKATSLKNLKRFDEALECFDKAIELRPDLDIIKIEKESCLKEKNRYMNSKNN